MNIEVQPITPAKQKLCLLLCELKHGRQVEYDAFEADLQRWVDEHGEPTDENVAAWAKEKGL